MITSTGERGYHHGDLRDTLLNAALASIAEHGTEHLSLRALARAAGVSATAPYRHFPTKRCLLAALITQGFRDLERAVADAADAAGDEDGERLVQIGMAYVRFALDHPTRYHLMFSTVLGDFSEYAELTDAASGAYDVVLRALEAAGVEARVPGLTVIQAGGVAWSAVHGLSSLLLFGRSKRSTGGPRSPVASLVEMEKHTEQALRLMMRGLLG